MGVGRRLRTVASSIYIKPGDLVEYFIREHHESLTDDSAHLYKDVNELKHSELLSFAIDIWARNLVKDLAVMYKIRMQTVVTIILTDNLNTLETDPTMFPWIEKEILSRKPRARIPGKTSVISISTKIHEKLNRYLFVIADNIEDKVTLTDYLNNILLGIPEDEIIKISQGATKEVLKEFMDNAGTTSRKSVRVPKDFKVFVEKIKDITGVPEGYILDYLIKKELNAAEQEMTINNKLLPENLRERWVVLLRDLLNTESKIF